MTKMKAKMKKSEAAGICSGINSRVPRELMLETAHMLENASSWVIFSHVNPDGDSLGSTGALFGAGLARGKRVRWLSVDPIPTKYLFLPHVEECETQKKYTFDSKDDLYVFLDSANEERGVEGLKERSPGTVVLNIDHHEDNTGFGTLNCVDGEASSTSEVLWHIMTEAGWAITPAIAECLYTGVAADTGWFSFGNTTSGAHMMAADLLSKGADPVKIDSCLRHNRSVEGARLWALAFLRIFRWGEASQFAMTWLSRRDFDVTGSVSSDTETLVNQMLMIRGVSLAVLLTEDSGEERMNASFRSKAGSVAAASVARALGGGGHPKAAGACLASPLGEAIRIVQETVDKIYAEWALADR
ncbi:MAG: DHH family phosphoesterase [Synergistaceae bacterium]|nr:DHH family phosphoesterase [Synergistaceae bacterium]